MKNARILIVEDEVIIAMEIEECLRKLNFEITSIVDTGEKAIKKAETDNPDLILMDIRIKGEMDGIDTAEIIRSRFGIPVVFSTAYLEEGRIERAKITMPFGYVLKPIQERELKVTLEMALYVAEVDKSRKQALETLKINEEKYRLLFELSPDGLVVTRDGLIENVNQELLNILGLKSVEEIIGTRPSEWGSTESQDLINGRMEQLYERTGKLPVLEYKLTRKDGSLIDVEARSSSMRDVDGTLSLAVMRDITERKRSEEEVLNSQRQLKIIADNIPAYIAYVGLDDLHYQFVNKKFEEGFGIPHKKIVGSHIKEIIGESNYQFALRYLEMVQSGQAVSYINEFNLEEGKRWVKVNYVPDYDDKGDVKAVVVLSHDITEHKQAEAALKESEEKLKQILQMVPDCVMMLDLDYHIKYINKTVADYSIEQIVEKSIDDLLTDKSKIRMRNDLKKVVETGEEIQNDIEILSSTGESRPIQSRIGPLKNEQKIIGLTIVIRDNS